MHFLVIEAIKASTHGASELSITGPAGALGQKTYSAIESSVSLVKSALTSIFSFGPNLAHFMTSCEAMSCISSNMPRIEIGPKADFYVSEPGYLLHEEW